GLSADAGLVRRYMDAVLQADRPDRPGPLEQALDKDLEEARNSGNPEEVVRVLVEIAATVDSAWRCHSIALELNRLNRHMESQTAVERAADLLSLAVGGDFGRFFETLPAADRARVREQSAEVWVMKGDALLRRGRYEPGLIASERAIELDPDNASAWSDK